MGYYSLTLVNDYPIIKQNAFQVRRGRYSLENSIIWASSYSAILYPKELQKGFMEFYIQEGLARELSESFHMEQFLDYKSKCLFYHVYDENFESSISKNNLMKHSTKTDIYYIPLATTNIPYSEFPPELCVKSSAPRMPSLQKLILYSLLLQIEERDLIVNCGTTLFIRDPLFQLFKDSIDPSIFLIVYHTISTSLRINSENKGLSVFE
jgi:hypothetical protein